MMAEQPEAAPGPTATPAAAVAAAVPPPSPPTQPAQRSPFELAAAAAGQDEGSRSSSPVLDGLAGVPRHSSSGTASAAPLGRRSGGGDTGSGPRLALQESLRRRSESAASDRLPPLPPAGSSRPASAASQYSLEAQSFHSTGSRAGQRRPSVRRSASAASIPSSHSSMMDAVMIQLQSPTGAGEGPCECRVLLPGLDLSEHGLECLQEELAGPGGDLAVVTAPRGVNLREAIGQALSQSQLQLDAESASLPRSQQWGSLPGTPATLPATLAPSPATAAQGVWPPDGAGPVPPLDQQQAGGTAEGMAGAGQQAADWQWLLRGRFNGGGGSLEPAGGNEQLSLSMRLPPPPGAAAAMVPAPQFQLQLGDGYALETAEQEQQQQQQPRATTLDQLELMQAEAPAVRLEGARPWSYDGTAASLGVPRPLKPSSLEVAYRARAAARMWPMLAPFVPRMLRQLILQAGSLPTDDGGAGSLVNGSLGRAIAARASATPQHLSRTMRPCMDSFPAAVLIADVSGFTALTEALGGQGSAGVELLTKCMNRYFTKVIDLLLLYGGDVEKFAGDSMIVVFMPTPEEAEGAEDGGLAAATLRAVTCGSQLAARFGGMRMLPNGEVVPIPAVERWAAEADAADAAAAAARAAGEHTGLKERLEDLRDMLAAPAGKALVRGTGLAVRAPGLLATRAPGLAVKAAGGGARVTANVLGKAAGPLAGASQRLGRGARNTRSEVHLPSATADAASVASSVDGSPRHASISSGSARRKLVRALSTPDSASLLPPEHALGDESSGGPADAPAGTGQLTPVRALARQSSNIASAVLSRLSRGSASGGGSRRGRSTLGSNVPAGPDQSALDAAADAAIAATTPAPAAAAADKSTAAGSDAATAAGSDAATAAAVEQRQQRERRLQEQALAELAVLAGPAAAMRPPELPSAASVAEAAELRLQEQRALYQRQQLRHPTMPASTLAARLAAAEPGGGGVLRTVTAPPAVADMLAGIAAEHQAQQQQQQQQQTQQLNGQPAVIPSGRSHGWDSAGDDASLPGGSASYQSAGGSSGREPGHQVQQAGPTADKRRQLQAVPSGASLAHSSERIHSSPAAEALQTVASGDTLSPGGSGDVPADPAAPLQHAAAEAPAAEAAEEPEGEGMLANEQAGRPSMLRRLLSAAALPWRGRSISGAGEAAYTHGGGPDAACHSSSISMSVGSVAPWAPSLAELSSGLGLPAGSTTSQVASPAGSRFFGGRRSGHKRLSSGTWPWQPGSGGAPVPSASASHLGQPERAAGSEARPSASHLVPLARRSPVRWHGFGGPNGDAQQAPRTSLEGPIGQRASIDGGFQAAQQAQQAQQQAVMQVVLSLKVMVAAGTVCAFHIGGGQESADDASSIPRWEFFIGDTPQPEEQQAGQDGEEGAERPRPPIAQLEAAEHFAVSGEVILSPEVVALAGSACLLEPLGGGNARLLEVLEPYKLPPEALQEAEATTSLERAARQVARERAALSALPEAAQGHALQLLRMHLLENVRVRVEAGHIDYVNELRVGTVLFLGFPSLLEPPPTAGPGAARTGLAAVQACMEAVQKRMRQHDGSFLQFRCDEKGFLAICAFGLPGRSHEDGPARGIQAALAIVETVKRKGGRACCGVTTGQLFCAMVGSQRRSEYTVFGNAINLSARLMVRARDRGAEVYCDATTQQLAKHKAVYQQLDPVRVKGRQLPVDIYEVTSLHAEALASGQRPGLSPLLPTPLQRGLPPVAEAAAAAAAAHLCCQGSAAGAAAVPPPAEGSLQALAAGVVNGAQATSAGPQQAQQSGSGTLVSMSDRLLSIASTAAAPVGLLPHTPMIGRDGELAAITMRCVDLVRHKRGGLVLVEGEAGMGKTRLVEELQHSELGGVYNDCNMFLGLGRRERKSQARYPWRRVLREMFHHDRQLGQVYCLRGTDPVVVATELALRLQAAVPDFAQWRHLLADALDLPLSEFPPALPTLEQHRQWLLEQRRVQAGMPMRGPSPESLDLLPGLSTEACGRLVEHPDRLGEADEVFLSAADRAKSFASRMKRSASLTLGTLGQGSASPVATQQALLRGGTPSPRKMARLRQHHEAIVWQQAQAVAASSQHPLDGQQEGEGSSDEEADTASQGSFGSSEAASFTSSFSGRSTGAISTAGSPSTGMALEGSNGRQTSSGAPPPSAASVGTSGSWGRASRMQRSATSRGAGNLTLRPSSPGREISTHLRAKKVQELVVAIIRQFTEAYGPLILVLEDLHNCDAASFRLLSSAINDEPLRRSVLFIVTYRPYVGVLSPALRQKGAKELFYQRVQAAYRSLLAQPFSLHLVLRPFDAEQSREFVTAALRGAQVPPDVAQLLWERSNGLPSFLEQLVVFLQLFVQTQMEANNTSLSLTSDDGRLRRRTTAEEVQAVAQAGLDFIRNNVSINSIITDRVDRLRPEEQLTLKVASILGLTIYRQLLQATHPQHPSPVALEASLCALEGASFLRQDPLDPATWRFCQVLARDVVYEMVPQDVRRDWHAAAAAAMEAYSSDQMHLPPSTIAWHWGQSCKGAELTQWQRSFTAAQWWEKAALASLDNGAYADALPLLQKAQDVARALESHFAGHSRSFLLMRRAQAHVAAQAAAVAAGRALPGGSSLLPPDQAVAAAASLPLVGSGELESVLPLIPRLRRAHWERCMAAMCIAVELSAESLHEAKTHCLLALYLLDVPLPSSEEYLAAERRRHWWPQSGPLAHLASAVRRVAGACWRGAGGEDRLLHRARELESGGYAWMARPSIPGRRWRRIGSAAAPPPLGVGPGTSLAAGLQPVGGGGMEAQRQPPSVAPSGTGGGANSFDASAWRQAALAGGWDGRNGGSSAGDASLASWGASAPLAAAAPGVQQEQSASGAGPVGAALLLHPSPFDLSLGGAGAAAQPTAADGVPSGPAAAGSAAAAAPTLVRRSLTGAPGLIPPSSSYQSSLSAASGKRPTGGSVGGYSGTLGMPSRLPPQAEEQGSLGGSGSQRMFLPWQTAGLQAQAAAAAAGAAPGGMPAAGQPAGEQLPQWQTVSDGASMSVLPSRSGPAELWGADEPPSFAAQREEDQEAEQRRVRHCGLAGDGQRYSREACGEAALVLDLLVSLLLAPQQGHADVDGLRYVRWACRHLQGGRPSRHSPLWPVYRDALEGLRRCQQGQWPPVPTGEQLLLGALQQEPALDEAAAAAQQPLQHIPEQHPQQPVMATDGGAAPSAPVAGGGAAQAPYGVPAMPSLCVIAGEVAQEMARSSRPQPEEQQRQGLTPLGGGTAGGIPALPP